MSARSSVGASSHGSATNAAAPALQNGGTPLSGKAEASTRIRLATTQNIVVTAKTSKGAFFTASKLVKVTIGGCGG